MKSIRIQLLILVFTAMLPALGIIIYSNYERQRHDIDIAKADAVIMLQGLANDHESVMEVTRRFLMTLTKLPALRNQDATACNKLFRELLKENSQYANIFAADREGMIFANALPSGTISIKQSKYFQEALQAKAFSIGEYVIGAVSRRAVLPFAYPVMDSSGRVTGVVGLSLDLDKYNKNFATMTRFPQGSSLNLLDRNYIRLYRHPHQGDYLGQVDLPEIVRQLSAGPQQGVFTSVGIDGIKRFFAYKRFSLSNGAPPYLYMRVGIPEEQTLALAKNTFLRNIGLLIGSLIAALLVTWLLGNFLIGQRLNRLIDATLQVGCGDFTARTGIDHKGGELGQLARSFDNMAEALEAKELDRKHAEEMLQQSEAFLNTLLDSIPIPVFYKDTDGRYRGFNKAYETFFGATKAQLIGKTVFDINPPELAKIYHARDNELLESGRDQHYETQLKNALGVTRDVIFDKAVFTDSQGTICGLIGAILDITERKHADEALRQERQRLDGIIKGTNAGTWEWNIPTGETVFNDRWAEIIGYTLEEISPISIYTWMKFSHPDDLHLSNELLERHFRGELDYYELEVRMKHKDGSWVWVLARGKVTKWTEDGKPLVMSGTHQDINTRKQAEEKINHLATHDVLTDLPSLRLARDRMVMAMGLARRHKTAVAVMFVDLDGFKSVNDNLGHDTGDYVLKQVAQRLLSCVRETDTVARVGGDEFLLVATEIHDRETVSMIAERVMHLVPQLIVYKGGTAVVGASIGIALYPGDGEDMDQLIKKADEAMYRIKKAGKNGFCFINTTAK